MEDIQNQRITIHKCYVNRTQIDNIWNEISISMGFDATKRSLEGLLEFVSNNQEANGLSYQALNPLIDCPWSARDLSDELMVELDKIGYGSIVQPGAICVDEVKLGNTYVPHKNLKINVGERWRKEEVRAIIHEIVNGPRKYCFLKTRAVATMTRIIQDFFSEMRQMNVGADSLPWRKYPLRYPKGCEAKELKRVYKEILGVSDIDEFHSRAALDFLTSIYLWTCLKYNTLKELVVAGSLFCFATCVDYVGEQDDAGCGTVEAYCEAAGLGQSVYACCKLSTIAEISVLNAAFIVLKSDIRNTIRYKQGSEPCTLSPPTPLLYMEARFWDGAMPAYLKVPLGLASVRKFAVPLDKYGSPLGTRNCCAIRNTVELIVRYNDASDLIHDIGCEPLNELHVAFRHCGLQAVVNYGNACAACVEQCTMCSCEDPSHDWAFDFGAGIANWYAIVPRYKAWPQLAEMCHFSAAKYEELIKNSRHGAFITAEVAVLEENTKFWDEGWVPMIKMRRTPPYATGKCEHCLLITWWLTGRCLYRDAKNRKISVELLRKHVHDYAHRNSSVDMTGFWRKIVEIAVGSILEYDVVQEYGQMAETVWERLRYVLKLDANLEIVMKIQVDTWFEIDKLLIKSYNFRSGHVIRRALMGVLGLQIERTDVALHQRIVNGLIAYSLLDNS